MVTEGVSIIIPTYDGGEIFRKCLKALKNQNYSGLKEILIIDSGSTDGTYETALEAGAEVKRISQEDFHHSRTRNEAVSLARYPNVVLLVQDAIPISEFWLHNLVEAINLKDVVAVYGQQLPHIDAELFARFEVEYHAEYLGDKPIIQMIESFEDFQKLSYDEALRRVRFDNVCAIYKREHLQNTSFPDVPFGEDMAWALEIMKQGYKVMYQPSVKVYHSHNRTPDYRFRRAIIDTIVCSELLGKAREDTSFLGADDLCRISLLLDEIINNMYSEIKQKYGQTAKVPPSNPHLEIISKLPFIKQMARVLFTILRKNKMNKLWDIGMKQSIENHIRHVISIINEKYSGCNVDELLSVVDQIAASTRGRMFGEVYASYKLKGHVPAEIEELILPHLWGV